MYLYLHVPVCPSLSFLSILHVICLVAEKTDLCCHVLQQRRLLENSVRTIENIIVTIVGAVKSHSLAFLPKHLTEGGPHRDKMGQNKTWQEKTKLVSAKDRRTNKCKKKRMDLCRPWGAKYPYVKQKRMIPDTCQYLIDCQKTKITDLLEHSYPLSVN